MKTVMLFLVLILPVSCKTQQVSISNIEWRLVKMNGDELPAVSKPVTLTLDTNKISGFAGCNRFFGSYTLVNSTITFSGIGSTKMYCQDSMSIEDNFFKALGEIQSFKADSDKLFLLSGEKVILEFKR